MFYTFFEFVQAKIQHNVQKKEKTVLLLRHRSNQEETEVEAVQLVPNVTGKSDTLFGVADGAGILRQALYLARTMKLLKHPPKASCERLAREM